MPSGADVITLDRGVVLHQRYGLQALLGSGSMAEVWLAHDEERKQDVAIKIVAALLAPSDQARQRFAREVAAIGRIHHPNVVRLLDHGTLEDNRPFLVMDYQGGSTLDNRLQEQGQLAIEEVFDLGCQLAAGLGAAHGEGVIHRDLKPANILLVEDASTTIGQVKILDFGVARMRDIAQESTSQHLTATGTMLGSPRYMPLEVARGADDVDERSDLFELGAVLYHALTGSPPFKGKAIGEIMRKIINHQVLPLQTARPDAPLELVDVVERAMARRPEDRYANTAELQWALDVASS
ncbi:MAG: serine/threonine protein kinase [Deltaproteobacteria bacterium]|nr:serine/threonine protein kinase [Deltaproteobacteria bacterium]